MIYTDFQDKKLSQLGFGTMRLPMADGVIDEAQVTDMVRLAMENGVNYFDTAWPYHGGESERVIGRVLAQYPRESWYLATKYPGHQISSSYDPAAIFEEQLCKCGVEYFDFYLLHNVYENSIDTYLDPKWGIIDYFREQKRLGRIRHLGFSCHGCVENLRAFLDAPVPEVGQRPTSDSECLHSPSVASDAPALMADIMEFCQIQLNWLDWTLQKAQEKVALLNERSIPIWVMEPVRGGRLCQLNEQDEATLRKLRPEAGMPEWGFRFLQDIPGVTMILSGMSSMDQLQDNLRTFARRKPLTEAETAVLLNIAEGMKDSVPCTACRYCTPHCPMGLDIPLLLATYNELRFSPAINVAMRLEGLPADKQPSACIGCGACAAICPQRIDIPAAMKDLAEKLAGIPKWTDICRQREEAARKAKGHE